MINKESLKISETEYYDSSIERLANQANNSNEYAQKRMSPKELKERFMLPIKLVKEHLNKLIDLLDGLDEDGRITTESILGIIRTGIPLLPTMYDLLRAFQTGELPNAIRLDDEKTLGGWISEFETALGITINDSGKKVVYKLVEAKDLEQLLLMLDAYINGEIGGGNDEEAQHWIKEFEHNLGISADGTMYNLIADEIATKMQELVEKRQITTNSSTYHLVEQMAYTVLQLWIDMLVNQGLITGASIQDDTLLKHTDGKHIRFTSDEEMEPINDMLDAYVNGEIGSNAVSPTAKVTQTDTGATITITDKDGTTTATVVNGKDGADGEDGQDGAPGKDGVSVTVASVNESASDGGSNIVTFSDGKTLTVKNGAKGSTGAKGDTGADGKSSYAYAQEGGYTGTEAEFAKKLASGEGENYVTAYGAKGDGKTDDTLAFQNALAAERVVFVPGGEYVLSDELVIERNCCLELSQDTVLRFKQTDKPCISMLRSANLKGNHATIFVPYTFDSKVINCDNGDDYDSLDFDRTLTGDAWTNARNNANNVAVPPFKKWDPMWKMTRYVTDINICKATDTGSSGTSGLHYSLDGKCYGIGIYLHCDKSDYPVNYMWGVSMSGVRIAGGFNYGIRIYNIGDTSESWNHDMRIEAVIDACKIGVSVENCRYARLAVTVQPRKASDGTVYAEHGIELIDSRGVDLSSSRVWDWNGTNTLWSSSNKYQHIAMLGECRGLILDDFLYNESSPDIRKLIYTDTASNLEQMTILQEPIDRWFKVKDGQPYYDAGTFDKRLATQDDLTRVDELEANFVVDRVGNFTDVLKTAIGTDGDVYEGTGYKVGRRLNGYDPPTEVDSSYYVLTGFIPCKKGDVIYADDMSFEEGGDYCRIQFFDRNFDATKWEQSDGDEGVAFVNQGNLIANANKYVATYTQLDGGFSIKVSENACHNDTAYFRLVIHKTQWGEHPVISVNEPIEYKMVGVLSDNIKVKAENVLGNPATGGNSLPYIVGDSTEAGAWTGTCESITAYDEGLTILYKTNIAGVSGGTTLDINRLGALPVYRNASTAVTTIYPVGTVLMLTYSEGAWLTADYDANTKTSSGTSNKTGTKMYLVGGTSQNSSGVTTYTNKNVYIGTDNELYSNGKKVAHAEDIPEVPDVSGFVKSVNGATPDTNGNVTVATGGGEGIEYVEKEILAPYTYTPYFEEAYQCYMYMIPKGWLLEEGKEYIVTFDGVRYPCTAYISNIGGMSIVTVGNKILIGENTGEPFAIGDLGFNGATALLGFDDNEHTISVSQKLISDKYIPTNLLPLHIHLHDITSAKFGDYFEIDVDPMELLSAYKFGRPIIVHFTHTIMRHIVPMSGHYEFTSTNDETGEETPTIWLTFTNFVASVHISIRYLVSDSGLIISVLGEAEST